MFRILRVLYLTHFLKLIEKKKKKRIQQKLPKELGTKVQDVYTDIVEFAL